MIKLITLLVGFFPALIGGFINFLGRKWAVFGATSVLMVTLTVALIGAVNTIVQGVMGSATIPGWAVDGIGLGIPGDFGICIAALCSSRIVRAAYDLAMEKARAFNNAQ